jgi:superoxide reductase
MATYECSVCGHVEFDEVPELCLVCRSGKDAFKENAEAIKQPANPADLSEGDRKHIPIVSIDGGVVQVTVGEIEHVMQDAHFIQYIDFYVNKTFVSRTWLAAESTKPYAAIKVAAESGTVQVVENCNVHGNWLTEVAL